MKQFESQWVVRIVIILALGLIVAILARTEIVRGFGGRFFGWMERPLTLIGSVTDQEGEIFFASRGELINELQDREKQVLELAQTASAWEDAERTLDQALKLLHYSEQDDVQIIATKVLARARTFNDQELLIDIGSEDGIGFNDTAISDEGVFVGTVDEVSQSTARVSLVTNAKSVVGASLLDSTGTIGIVSGGHGSLVQMGFVPRDTDVQINDVIITSGVDPNVPRGLVIGLVNSITEDESAPFLDLYIEPLADLQHLRLLGILDID